MGSVGRHGLPVQGGSGKCSDVDSDQKRQQMQPRKMEYQSDRQTDRQRERETLAVMSFSGISFNADFIHVSRFFANVLRDCVRDPGIGLNTSEMSVSSTVW